MACWESIYWSCVDVGDSYWLRSLFDLVEEWCKEGAWVLSNTAIGGLWVGEEGGICAGQGKEKKGD